MCSRQSTFDPRETERERERVCVEHDHDGGDEMKWTDGWMDGWTGQEEGEKESCILCVM